MESGGQHQPVGGDRPESNGGTHVLVAVQEGGSGSIVRQMEQALDAILSSAAAGRADSPQASPGMGLGRFVEGPAHLHIAVEVLDGQFQAVLERGALVLIERRGAQGPKPPSGLGWVEPQDGPGRRWVLRVPARRTAPRQTTLEVTGPDDASAPLEALRGIGVVPDALVMRAELDVRRRTWIVHDGDGRVDLEVVLDELATPQPATGATMAERWRTELRVTAHGPVALTAARELVRQLGLAPARPADAVRFLVGPRPRAAMPQRPSRASAGESGVRLNRLLARAGVTTESAAEPRSVPVSGPSEARPEPPAITATAVEVGELLDEHRLTVAGLIRSGAVNWRSLTDRSTHRARVASRRVGDGLDLAGPGIDGRWAADVYQGLSRFDDAIGCLRDITTARNAVATWAVEDPDGWSPLVERLEGRQLSARRSTSAALQATWASELAQLLSVARVPFVASDRVDNDTVEADTVEADTVDNEAVFMRRRWSALVEDARDAGDPAGTAPAAHARWLVARDARAALEWRGGRSERARYLERCARQVQRAARDLAGARAVLDEMEAIAVLADVTASEAYAAGRAHEMVRRRLRILQDRWQRAWRRLEREAGSEPAWPGPPGR